MTFSDIFKKSFLDGFSSADINIYTATAAMLVACCVGFYIFVVYRVLTRKTFYSKTFSISLAAITVITAAVIVTIQSSIVVLDKLPVAKAPMILVVNTSDVEAEARIMGTVAKYAGHSTVKSRNMTGNTLDLIVELRTAAGSELLKDIVQEESVTSASLLSHDGEVTF